MDEMAQSEVAREWRNDRMNEENRLFLVNRALIVLAIALILAGLFFDQYRIVLRNAILL